MGRPAPFLKFPLKNTVKKNLLLVTLCCVLGAASTMSFAQSFVVPKAPVCPTNASRDCALQAQAANECAGSKSRSEFATCANAVFERATSPAIAKNPIDAASVGATVRADGAVPVVAAPAFVPPPPPACPKAGVAGRVECELAQRAFAACSASKTASDFSDCYRAFSSTKAYVCALASDSIEKDKCANANKSRGK